MTDTHLFSSYTHSIWVGTLMDRFGEGPIQVSKVADAAQQRFIREEPIDVIRDELGRPLDEVYPHGPTLNWLYFDGHVKAVPLGPMPKY